MDKTSSAAPPPDSLEAHVAWLDRDGVIVDVNEEWRAFAERNDLRMPRHAVGSSYLEVCASARGAYSYGAHDVAHGIEDVLSGTRSRFAFEYPCHAPARRAWYRLVAAPLPDGHEGCVVTHQNITPFCLRELAHRADHVERLGHMAGGVAHQYNNLLQIVLGFGLLLSSRGSVAGVDVVEEILHTAERGGKLGMKLIAFRGGEVRNPGVVELGRLAAAACQRVRERWPGSARPYLEPSLEACLAFADEAQLGRAVDELLDNALRAISDQGGVVTVSTAREVVDYLAWERHPAVPAGEYVALAVADSGPGMDAGVLDRAIEPFFTTDPGRVGLGLSVAYGLAKQNGGFLLLDSEPGGPTCCRILLPPYARP